MTTGLTNISFFNKKQFADTTAALKSSSLATSGGGQPTALSSSAVDLIASSNLSPPLNTAKFTPRTKLNKSPSDESIRSLPSSTSGRIPAFLGSVVDSVGIGTGNLVSNSSKPQSSGGKSQLHQPPAHLSSSSYSNLHSQHTQQPPTSSSSASSGAIHQIPPHSTSSTAQFLSGSSSSGGLVTGDRLIAGLANPSAAGTTSSAATSHTSTTSGSQESLGKSSKQESGSAVNSQKTVAPVVGVTGEVVGMPNGSGATTAVAASSSSASSAASSSSTQVPGNNNNNKGYRPDDALHIFGSKLTSYEHTEIYNYQRVYFVGSQAKKRICVAGGSNNSNFDDENGSYMLTPHDHVAYRYEILKVIGKGSFGQVIKAYDHKHQQYVALKLVRNEKRFHRQAEEEIRILDHLRRQDTDQGYNVIHMLDNFNFRNHKCITFELMSINLYELIKKNKFQGFNLALVRKFAYSMLQCLELLNRNHLIHCDLKPENVLLKTPNRSSIKVIDFGSSCFDDQRIYTYIQSRFYRAPEVIMGSKYGMPIDMWSLGCILAELLTGYPLLPGEDENDQLALIVELLGAPSPKIIDGAKRARNFFSSKGHPRYCQVTQLIDGTTGPPGSRSLQSALKNQGDDLFLDFLRRCLDWDADARLTPQQALKHSWLRRRLPRPPATGSDSLSAVGVDSILPAGLIK
uniref:Dual specificity tyrosine-phosphorylation-regulated kinase mbk-2 n=1 Tax=Ditylenchus dipsaci TaxID=166011 RepID=A0A915D2W2_9BILA